MRQRITFLHKPQDAVDPNAIEVTTNSLAVSDLQAAREDRITLSLDELPEEIRLVLEQSHELHIRYISGRTHEMASPVVSRLSPGLHVYYSPQRNAKSQSDLVCPLINHLFQLKDASRCLTPEKSFTSLPAQRFQHSTEYEYYQPESHFLATAFVNYLESLCPSTDAACGIRVRRILDAASIDLDFDTISHTLNAVVFWNSQKWDFDILSKSPNDRIEVGILSVEKAVEPEEISLGGFLTVVGQDTKPGATLFAFPARHHPLPASFSSTFLKPTGLHPDLQLKISNSNPPAGHETCSLHAYLTLPRVIFADRNQLYDPMFMASKNLSTIRYITQPVDLEAPEYTMSLWGSSLLLELAPPPRSLQQWQAEIPLHLRYLPPSDSGYRQVSIPSPVLFWACTADAGSKFTINPFDRVNLGYDGLFGPRTMFYHLTQSADGTNGYNTIDVPVLSTAWAQLVETGTAAVMFLGCGWIMWKLLVVWMTSGYRNHTRERLKTQ